MNPNDPRQRSYFYVNQQPNSSVIPELPPVQANYATVYGAPRRSPARILGWVIVVMLVFGAGIGSVFAYWQFVGSKQQPKQATPAQQSSTTSSTDSNNSSTNGSLSPIQSKARDTERQVDIKAIFSQLEAYYAQNGHYPSLDQINHPAWREQNMSGLDDEALKDPLGAGPELAAKPAAHVYAYQPLGADGKVCDNTTSDCATYTLTATLETGGTFVKQQLTDY